MLRAGLKFLIKDALRGARYTVRQSTRIEPPIDFPGRRQLTDIADTVLTSIEETVVTLRYGSDLSEDMIRSALGDYVSLAGTIHGHDFESRFCSTNYRLSKAILARRRADTLYISELAYASAARRIVQRARGHGLAWAGPAFAAEVTAALIEAAPIRSLPALDTGDIAADVFRAKPNEACAFAVGLAVTAWLTKGETVSPVECTDSASGMVEAAYERLKAAQDNADPIAALARIFGELATFVP